MDRRALQRQFRLVSTNVANDGGELNGEYRGPCGATPAAPVTVVGTFTLHRTGANRIAPVAAPTTPTVVADTATTTQNKAVSH
ncbi:MAG: hypothetical protein R2932_01045 [Caldilineaceae bacterium]